MIIGYWQADVCERFGLQLTAPSLPDGVYGGWTYMGEFAADERDGFGEACFAFTQCDRRWVMEEGGRVVGFWRDDILQGPAWKVHLPDSRHYRGKGHPGAKVNCSLVWFLSLIHI